MSKIMTCMLHVCDLNISHYEIYSMCVNDVCIYIRVCTQFIEA